MKDVVRCPGCLAGFRFPADPPRAFTCPACGAEMDLSAYAPSVPVAPAVPMVAIAPAVSVPPVVAAPPPAGSHAPHAHHHRRPARKSPATMLLVGGVVVVGVGALALVVGSQGSEATLSPAERVRRSVAEEEARRGPVVDTSRLPPAPIPAVPDRAPPTPPEPRPRKARAPEAPTGERGPREEAAPPPAPRRTEVRTWPWPAEVTAEERSRIEAAITSALEVGGSDGLRAERLLASMGLKAAPRLIGEFKTIRDRYGLEREDGLSRAMVVDRVLRRIDGVQERWFGDTHPIHPNSDPKSALETVQNWNWWWETEEYRKHPRPPWDPHVDEKDQ